MTFTTTARINQQDDYEALTSYGSKAAPSEPQDGVVANFANSFVLVLLGTCTDLVLRCFQTRHVCIVRPQSHAFENMSAHCCLLPQWVRVIAIACPANLHCQAMIWPAPYVEMVSDIHASQFCLACV